MVSLAKTSQEPPTQHAQEQTISHCPTHWDLYRGKLGFLLECSATPAPSGSPSPGDVSCALSHLCIVPGSSFPTPASLYPAFCNLCPACPRSAHQPGSPLRRRRCHVIPSPVSFFCLLLASCCSWISDSDHEHALPWPCSCSLHLPPTSLWSCWFFSLRASPVGLVHPPGLGPVFSQCLRHSSSCPATPLSLLSPH